MIESNRPPKRVGYQWYRCEETFEALLDWLRSKGVTGNKPLHQLRKLYGSEMASVHGIHAASSGLRHSDIKNGRILRRLPRHADRGVRRVGFRC